MENPQTDLAELLVAEHVPHDWQVHEHLQHMPAE
jgi:hypothetical protein